MYKNIFCVTLSLFAYQLSINAMEIIKINPLVGRTYDNMIKSGIESADTALSHPESMGVRIIFQEIKQNSIIEIAKQSKVAVQVAKLQERLQHNPYVAIMRAKTTDASPNYAWGTHIEKTDWQTFTHIYAQALTESMQLPKVTLYSSIKQTIDKQNKNRFAKDQIDTFKAGQVLMALALQEIYTQDTDAFTELYGEFMPVEHQEDSSCTIL